MLKSPSIYVEKSRILIMLHNKLTNVDEADRQAINNELALANNENNSIRRLRHITAAAKIAAARGYEEIVNILLSHNASIKEVIEVAALHGQASLVVKLIMHVSSANRTSSKTEINSAAHNAAFGGHVDLVNKLMQLGADISHVTKGMHKGNVLSNKDSLIKFFVFITDDQLCTIIEKLIRERCKQEEITSIPNLWEMRNTAQLKRQSLMSLHNINELQANEILLKIFMTMDRYDIKDIEKADACLRYSFFRRFSLLHDQMTKNKKQLSIRKNVLYDCIFNEIKPKELEIKDAIALREKLQDKIYSSNTNKRVKGLSTNK